jgi:hypothetical protein
MYIIKVSFFLRLPWAAQQESFKSMFRFVYLLLTVLANVLAYLSPLVLIQWLVNATKFEFLVGLFSWLNPISGFLNGMVDAFFPIKFAPILFGTTSVPVTQAISGALLAAMFMVLSWATQRVKQGEQEFEVLQKKAQAAIYQKQAEAKFVKQAAATASFKLFLVYVQFPFRDYPQLGQVFQQYSKYQGKALPGDPDTLFLGFNDLQLGLAFAIQAGKTLVDYYAKGRPSDPKPSFKCSLHVIWPDEQPNAGLEACNALSRYAPENGMLFSDAVLKVLEAKGLKSLYSFVSNGYYLFPNNQQVEVFTLNPTLPEYF